MLQIQSMCVIGGFYVIQKSLSTLSKATFQQSFKSINMEMENSVFETFPPLLCFYRKRDTCASNVKATK